MRSFSTLILAALFGTSSAQTVNTVQNGDWDAPSTWSCNCIPTPNSSLVIMHSVQLLGDLNMGFPQVQVTSTGEIMTTFPVNVINDGNFIMEGHVFFQGTFINLALVDITGFFEVAGVFHTDGDLVMDGGVLQVEGDFTNTAAVSGIGSICVYDITTNEGTISGTVDICDFTPTTAIAPIVDANTGTIEATVTYCTNSACAAGIAGSELMQVSISVVAGGDGVVLNGLPIGAVVTVVDALGHTCTEQRTSTARMELDAASFAGGAYRVVVRSSDAVRSMLFILAH